MQRRFSRIFNAGTVLVLVAALAGCQTTAGDKVSTVAQPKTPVAKTLTSFAQAKRCMDSVFLRTGKSNIAITTGDINDETGTVSVSEQDMIINAIADMSIRSHAFDFFTVEITESAAVYIQNAFVPLQNVDTSTLPGVYIRGSISQSDNNVTSDGQSGSVTLPFISVGKGKTQVAGTVSIDLQMVDIATRRVLQNVTTSNTITIISNDDSTSARGLINQGAISGAVSISLSSAQREGRSQAVRTLMEYSLIELLGKYTRVPYQRCLSLQSTDPTMMQEARDLYDSLKPEDRIRSIQTALASEGTYHGPADGQHSVSLQDAITLAKADRGLIPNGRIDFQLFNALYEENLISELPEKSDKGQIAQASFKPQGALATTGRDALGLKVSLTNPQPSLGDTINVRVATDVPAYVFCYYEYTDNGERVTARIFPNRFQKSNFLERGGTVVVPAPSDPFKIRLNNSENEAIACVATTVQYGGDRTPDLLRQGDLAPLACSYPGVGCPIYEHQKIDQFNTSAKKITFRAAI